MENNDILLTVDGCEPITFDEFYKSNTAPDVETLSAEEFASVKSLDIGGSIYLGMGVEIKRVG